MAQCYRARGDATREIEELQRAVALSGNSSYMRAHLAYGYATSLGLSQSCEDDAVRQLVELQRHQAEYASRDGRLA